MHSVLVLASVVMSALACGRLGYDVVDDGGTSPIDGGSRRFDVFCGPDGGDGGSADAHPIVLFK